MTDDYFVTCGKTGAAIRDCLVIDAHAHLGPVFGLMQMGMAMMTTMLIALDLP